MRFFEVISVEPELGGAGPERFWRVHYKAYVKKKWVIKTLGIVARNAKLAREQAINRFGDKSSRPQ